jgi:CheY-like chemotaxis protein
MSQPSILIVDDKTDLLDLFAVSLRKLPYRILTAQSGVQALDILEREIPVLLLLDVAMPAPGGIEVLHQVRANPQMDSMRILVVTAVPSRLEESDIALVDRVLPKPVTPRALEQAVIDVIGG